jgi:hypothetical protein
MPSVNFADVKVTVNKNTLIFLVDMLKVNNNNIIFYYLCAEPTAIRPITEQHSVDASNYIVDKRNISERPIKGKQWWKNTLMHRSKRTK